MKVDDIKNILPIDKAYQDALSPAVKQVGQVLESVAKTSRFLFAPIEYLATFQDRWQRYLTKVSEKVNEENLIEGQPQIVIPVLQGLSLTNENTLVAELFTNLLAKSIDKTAQDLAHPAFPSIIAQMSHDEAVMMYYLKHDIEIDSRFRTPRFIPDMKYRMVKDVDVLQFPKHYNIYRHHLTTLSLTFYNEAGYYCLTGLGGLFVQACVPDEFPELIMP